MWTERKPNMRMSSNSFIVLLLPLQAVSGSGSPSMRPSKCCRATSRSTPNTCGGSSWAAPRPTGTPSCRAHRPTTTTPTTAPPPLPPRQAACWAPPADRTARKKPRILKVCTVLHESFWLFFFFQSYRSPVCIVSSLGGQDAPKPLPEVC